MVRTRKIIDEMKPYVPGRSITDIAKEYGIEGSDIIKLGSNENPWGPSPGAIKATKESSLELNKYPESKIGPLKEKLAEYVGNKPEEIIVGGDGADEIIDILGKTFIDMGDEIIIPQPTYMYYEYTLQAYGAKPVYAKWDVEEGRIDIPSIIDAISPKTKIIFLCSPNNPTGAVIPQEDIKSILESAPDVLVVLDQAYGEYARICDTDLVDDYPNILIIKTMSKAMGLAGLRIGYGISNKDIIEKMHRVKPVFSLTAPSYAAALATIDDTSFQNDCIEKGITSRNYLILQMNKIHTLKVYPSEANFVLVDIRETGYTSTQLCDKLLEYGVIIRDCYSFEGLDEYFVRVSIGTKKDNKQFIKVLKEVLE